MNCVLPRKPLSILCSTAPWLLSLVMVLPCTAQTTPPQGHKPGQRPTGKPIPAAQAQHQPQYKGIWEPVNYKQDLTLTGVFFVSNEEGWVTGKHGTILHTKDGGNTWTPQLGGDPQSTEESVEAPRFLDAKHGWALQGGKILRTSNGENWEQIGTIPQGWGVVEYVFLSPTTGVMLDGNNNVSHILRTNNGGRNWKEVMTPKACHASIQVEGLSRDAECVLKAMHFVSASRGYAIGGTGTDFNTLIVSKTEDGGNTWDVSPLPDVGNVWIGGAWGADHCVFFTDENTGFANLNNAKLIATSNGGQSWHGVVASLKGESLRFADPEVGWSFYHQELYFTIDGGQHWNSRTFKFPADVNAFSLPRRDRAFVVGDHGMVYRYRVVPIEYAAAGALDAPAMPAYGGAILDYLQQMKAQVAALQAKLGAGSGSGGSASSRVPAARGGAHFLEVSYGPGASYEASQDTGGFVQDTDTSSVPTSSFMQNCCNQQVQSMQSSFSSFKQQIPTFSGKFRNLNLIFVGLNMALDLMGKAKQIRSAFVALKSAPDAQSAMAALSALSTNLGSTSQAINSNFQNILADVAPGGASGGSPGGAGSGGGVYSTGAGANSPGNQPPNQGGQLVALPATQNNPAATAGGPLTIGMLPFMDNTGSGGQAMALALSRAVQGEMAHSTGLQGRVLQVDSGTNLTAIDANAASAIGQAQNVRVILVGTVLEASSEQSTKNASGPSFGGFHIGGSANSVKANVTLQADLYSVSTGAKIDSIRVTGTNSQTKVGANVSTSLGDLSTGGAAFDNSPIGKALHGAVTQLVQKVAADEPKMSH